MCKRTCPISTWEINKFPSWSTLKRNSYYSNCKPTNGANKPTLGQPEYG